MIFTHTPRLILRAFNSKDADALFDYLSSPRAPCFYDEKLASLAEAMEEVKKRALDTSQFAVCLKESDELIGHLFADNSEEPDPNTWSVGWHFNSSYEGQGFATEAVTALFDYLFTQKAARRLYAYVEDYNTASQRLCDRLHMFQEGCFREFVSFASEDGGEELYDNTFVYALLKKEWLTRT
ncbi:TPA: GNAT family protein [Serratia marcescens]|uniref:GNAT family N-acetyltransferase n=1 Tax=Serratia marcescens TaxID=615 RepID=UPI000C1B60CD|nr:GNAT family protein [Serratia marcescens]PIN56245.1 GNAT family N-acetyltransferase [Serratia marcescens]QIO27487.1 GNAT family N-acetyltransferase [Serratia marcescens]HCR2976674.1 GNAT family N-acetyltransferase [Serratia marcescens]HCR3021270.1 GNAT family N-acetyltransferase [Serratia marcescens]HCR3025976.1 GNAT family N-acetyltransferase [Serratia marcescens]